MKVGRVDKLAGKDFDKVFKKKVKKGVKEWELLFSDTIDNVGQFSAANSFWYLGDFFTSKIVKAGGLCRVCSPISASAWVGMHPMEIGKFFHPDDLPKMEAFLVFMSEHLAIKTEKQRRNIKVSMLFRMKDGKNNYRWRLMDFPKIYYENNLPRYVFCRIADYGHFVTDPKCTMFVLDGNSKQSTLFYCVEKEVRLQPYENRPQLSLRELEIVRLLCRGFISKEIAAELGISKNTVENHKQNIFAKTGAKKLTELVHIANERNYLD